MRPAPAATTKDSCSSGTACVEGDSTGSSTFGVDGTSSADDGVYGKTTAKSKSGIYGTATGDGYWGVYGSSNDTTGHGAALRAQALQSATNIFFGYNAANKASCAIDPNADLTCTGSLEGNSTANDGVAGFSTNADGVFGQSNANGVVGAALTEGGAGVYGYNNGDGIGVTAQSGDTTGNYEAPLAVARTSHTNIFLRVNAADCTSLYCLSCSISPTADLSCTGTITGGSDVRVRRATSSGRHVLAYGSESTSATIEDFGTARMHGGVANVSLKPDFASTIDRSSPYYVFLTPLGDTRGLYVSIKTPSGFQVRETDRGHSSIAFDYRIVARPLGAKNDRLPRAPAMQAYLKPMK